MQFCELTGHSAIPRRS